MLLRSVFIPVEEIPQVFNLLEADEVIVELLPLLKYIGETYIFGRPTRGQRQEILLRFAHQLCGTNIRPQWRINIELIMPLRR